MKRVLITGSRDWKDRRTVWTALHSVLAESPEGVVVVHGAARGADDIADRWAHEMRQVGFHVNVEAHPADWGQYGKGAGTVRNRLMVKLGADVCLAFPLEHSIGTYDCMRRAAAAGIPVVNYGYGGNSDEGADPSPE